eukprot:50949-Eustigmatos_ZCMA.PRE.1
MKDMWILENPEGRDKRTLAYFKDSNIQTPTAIRAKRAWDAAREEAAAGFEDGPAKRAAMTYSPEPHDELDR